MLKNPGKLLIVDEDVYVRTSLALVFSALGYRVRSSEEALSGLSELTKEIPDVMLCDLNMERVSSLKFLLTVRRRFPSIRVIAMSKDLSGHRVPRGIAADALYQKGAGPVRLIKTVEAMIQTKRHAVLGVQSLKEIPPRPTAQVRPLPAYSTLMISPPLPKNDSEGEIISATQMDWAAQSSF
jgi:DNA-binding NarL/FixJ family response regulator